MSQLNTEACLVIARWTLIQAKRDLDKHSNFKDEGNMRMAEIHRDSALRFFRSSWCADICRALGRDYEKLKKSALK